MSAHTSRAGKSGTTHSGIFFRRCATSIGSTTSAAGRSVGESVTWSSAGGYPSGRRLPIGRGTGDCTLGRAAKRRPSAGAHRAISATRAPPTSGRLLPTERCEAPAAGHGRGGRSTFVHTRTDRDCDRGRNTVLDPWLWFPQSRPDAEKCMCVESRMEDRTRGLVRRFVPRHLPHDRRRRLVRQQAACALTRHLGRGDGRRSVRVLRSLLGLRGRAPGLDPLVGERAQVAPRPLPHRPERHAAQGSDRRSPWPVWATSSP